MMTSSKKKAERKKTVSKKTGSPAKKQTRQEGLLTVARAQAYSPGKAPILNPAIINNALPPVTGGQVNLLSLAELFSTGVSLSIPEWDNEAEVPGTSDKLVIYINNVARDDMLFDAPVATGYTWPFEVIIPENQLGAAGVKDVRYEVTYATLGMDTSDSNLRFTVVRTDPNAGLAPLAAMLPDWITSKSNTVTLEGLADNNDEVVIGLTPPIDRNVGDTWEMFLDYFDPIPLKTGPMSTTGPVTAVLTKVEIEAAGPGNYYLTYRFVNRAGFASPKAAPHPLRISLVPEPGALADPRVSNDPLTRTHAQEGKANLLIGSYLNARVGDEIRILFNSRPITHTLTDIVFDKVILIPWEVLAFGGIDAPYDADVTYNIVRDGTATPDSNTLTVTVDLRSAGGGIGGPGPVNDTLDPSRLESSQGEVNIISHPNNVGQNATITFNTYPNVALGHLVQVYLDGKPVLMPPHTVVQADIDNGAFEFTLLWSFIEAAKNGTKKLYYELNDGVTSSIIRSTETSVLISLFSVENPKKIDFVDSVPLGAYKVISCEQEPETGILINILDADNIQKDDKLTVYWQAFGPDSYLSTTPLPSTTGEFETIVSADHDTPGHPGESRRVPFIPYIQAIVKGNIEAYYIIEKPDGITQGTSDVSQCLVTRVEGNGDHCGVDILDENLLKRSERTGKKSKPKKLK